MLLHHENHHTVCVLKPLPACNLSWTHLLFLRSRTDLKLHIYLYEISLTNKIVTLIFGKQISFTTKHVATNCNFVFVERKKKGDLKLLGPVDSESHFECVVSV